MDKDKDNIETKVNFKLVYVSIIILLVAHLSGNKHFWSFANLFSIAVALATVTEVILKKHKRRNLHSED